MIMADTDQAARPRLQGGTQQNKPDHLTVWEHDRVSRPSKLRNNPDAASPANPAAGQGDFYAVLLAMACHDLRQPLQVIIGAHNLLAPRISADAPAQAALARIERAATQLAEGFSTLVDALHLRYGSGGDRLEPVSLDAIFAALVPDLAERARQKGIEFRVRLTRGQVLSHPGLLGGIMRNLMRNAVDYTPSGGRVLVACRRRGPAVHIEVRDNGGGIPADDHGRIFAPFHRADTTRAKGMGLGLFIVKHAAEHLGHRVELYSAPDRGSRFVIIAGAPDERSERYVATQPERAG